MDFEQPKGSTTMMRKAFIALLILALAALQIAPALAGDPSQWG
jgi:hypothetical protein